MSNIAEYSTAPSAPLSKAGSSTGLAEQGQGQGQEGASSSSSSAALGLQVIMPKHSSVVGHLVLIAQVTHFYYSVPSLCYYMRS